jgi:hypothetical protein
MKTNKIIAEFMGMVKSSIPNLYYTKKSQEGFGIGQMVELEFHTSWDWLMPVIEKIESMGFDVNILSNGTQIIDYSNNIEITNNVSDISFDRKIDHTYQAIVRFVSEIRD